MLCFHHNDLDGRAAAAVVRMWAEGKSEYPSRFVEVDYKDTIDLSGINVNELVVIVDFSFKPETMKLLLGITENVVWCDHHVTAKSYDYGRELKGYRDFTEKGLSGCECTWMYFHGSSNYPEYLSLIGDYDAWRMKQRPQCLQFYEGMKMISHGPTESIWDRLSMDQALDIGQIIESGKTVIRYRDMYCAELCKQLGYETEIDGVKAYACNQFRFGSQGFAERMQQYPICLAYAHNGNVFTVSLYSDCGIDVSVIAKRHGGGGHKGAAGFTCTTLPFQTLTKVSRK